MNNIISLHNLLSYLRLLDIIGHRDTFCSLFLGKSHLIYPGIKVCFVGVYKDVYFLSYSDYIAIYIVPISQIRQSNIKPLRYISQIVALFNGINQLGLSGTLTGTLEDLVGSHPYFCLSVPVYNYGSSRPNR